MRNGDPTIYDALHTAGSHYQPESIDFDAIDLVDIVKEGADKWIAARKTFGQRKPLEPE